MAGYIALYVLGLLCFVSLLLVSKDVIQVVKRKASNSDPLLSELKAQDALRELKSKKVLGLVLYVTSFCVMVWFMFYRTPTPDYVVTATELYQQFQDDERGALEMYTNKLIVVTGQYVEESVAYSNPALLLSTSNPQVRVQCNVPGKYADDVKALKVGDDVSLLGQVLGKRGNVMIEKCSVYP